MKPPTDYAERAGSPFAKETGPRDAVNHLSATTKAPHVNFADGAVVQTVEADFVYFDEEPKTLEDYMTPGECRTQEARRAVLRAYLGYDNRSLAQIASDLGLSRAAVSAIHRNFLVAIHASKEYRRAAARVAKGRKAA